MARAGTIRLTFDGGSLGNPGAAYGSYRVVGRGSAEGIRADERIRFGHGTNNEAEYWALMAGIRRAVDEARRRGLASSDLDLHILGDSQLVIRQLRGEWKARDVRMRSLRDETQDLLANFAGVRLEHRPRSKSVAEFGH